MNFDIENTDIAWCPGCGNFGILNVLKRALTELEINPQKLVLVSGIGQAAKTPHYLRTNFFNGLHGRALPPATMIKAVNPDLKVIITSGDGDMYGEGGNHFIHAIRRNPDVTAIVHNNMVYGLTKGQASPTSQVGFVTPIQVDGVFEEPFNPLAVAISLNASFVARTSIHNLDLSLNIFKQAIQHKGFALVDTFTPCISFNKINTRKWYEENTYVIDDGHDPTNRNSAFSKACESYPWPLGIIYKSPTKPSFEENLYIYQKNNKPAINREVQWDKLKALIESKSV
ncbi:MAG: 2-oxoacid ferredoxin oxidoreductase [Desulfobacterium sp.]|nr:2-oxoacid ferredoxin oxidoreductase [Desulfobacterium sp.]MBU3947753.1 2-oxoacid ferredoxin oxidoreductase [Pseudomonadota bacterium]MBU4011149.1 2-oxoacid ferredoxin oxidoreductase [Pseudomonadota bacterium]MBU4037656.1 2-oxoacid ferredoxin oxidoreductase [Pseudomonadota bacterium]